MRRIVFVLAVALAAAGCAKKTGAGDAVAKLTAFKERMCACSDRACADKVSGELRDWGKAPPGVTKTAPVNEEEAKELAAVTDELATCMARVIAASPATR